jgi:hypothetical protein
MSAMAHDERPSRVMVSSTALRRDLTGARRPSAAGVEL